MPEDAQNSQTVTFLSDKIRTCSNTFSGIQTNQLPNIALI